MSTRCGCGTEHKTCENCGKNRCPRCHYSALGKPLCPKK